MQYSYGLCILKSKKIILGTLPTLTSSFLCLIEITLYSFSSSEHCNQFLFCRSPNSHQLLQCEMGHSCPGHFHVHQNFGPQLDYLCWFLGPVYRRDEPLPPPDGGNHYWTWIYSLSFLFRLVFIFRMVK